MWNSAATYTTEDSVGDGHPSIEYNEELYMHVWYGYGMVLYVWNEWYGYGRMGRCYMTRIARIQV